MKKYIKKSILINKILFFIGYITHKIIGYTPRVSYMSMINLYCLTSGKFLFDFNKKSKVYEDFVNYSNFFKNVNIKDLVKINSELNHEGYSLFKYKLDKKITHKLKSFSYTLKAKVGNNQILYNPKDKKSNIYKFSSNDLIQNQWVQDLIMDPVLIKIARNYLGVNPIFDFAAMWWSTDSKTKKEDAAQEYHFDLDRPKWLKIFIYLTDVNKDNGPHCYISGTHKVGNKPQEILDRGYVRVVDKELENHYPKSSFKEVTGPAGTVVFGDTGCWHKGKPIIKGDRLILQLEYTSSMFGSNFPKIKIQKPGEKFIKFCNENKYYTQNIFFN